MCTSPSAIPHSGWNRISLFLFACALLCFGIALGSLSLHREIALALGMPLHADTDEEVAGLFALLAFTLHLLGLVVALVGMRYTGRNWRSLPGLICNGAIVLAVLLFIIAEST